MLKRFFQQFSRIRSSQKRSPVARRRLAGLEPLEQRQLLNVAPTLGAIDDVTLHAGAPMHIALDGFDADGDSLSFSATSSNGELETFVPTGNRSIRMSVEDFGDMEFQLFEGRAPRTTSRIIELVEAGFYTDNSFHRVVENFMIQGGDPTGTGSGGSGTDFDDEFHTDLLHTSAGLLSMAKSFDDTNDSQFFLTAKDTRFLDFNHTVFGLLTDGDDVRQAIASVETELQDPNNPNSEDSKPVEPVTISSITVFQDEENGVLMISAPRGTTGTADVTVTVSDGNGGQAQQTFQVTIAADPTNENPILDANDLAGADDPANPTQIDAKPGETVSFDLGAWDREGDDFYFGVWDRANSDQTMLGDDLEFTLDKETGEGTVTVPDTPGVYGMLIGVNPWSEDDYGDDYMSFDPRYYDSQTSSYWDFQFVPVYVSPAAPTGIELLASTDTGSADDDGLTNRDNSSEASNLRFRVSGVTPGAEVTLYADGQAIGQATLAADSTDDFVVVVTNGTHALDEGTREITAVQTLAEQAVNVGNVGGTTDLVSEVSAALEIELDTTDPQFTSSPVTEGVVGETYIYDVTTDETVSYQFEQSPAGMIINQGTGQITWTPQESQAPSKSVVLVATDAAGNETRQEFDVALSNPDGLAVHIEVSTNGEDADQAPGPMVAPGSAVTWTYTVTNPGTEALSDVVVTDSEGVTVTYQSGDTNDDDLLDLDETWTYQATGTATVGQYANTATVSAEGPQASTVSDTDPSHYLGVESGIRIEASTNGQDADDPEGAIITVGDAVTWTYTVTNEGNAPLSDVTVTDNQGVTVTYQSGDTDGDDLLDVGETWVYEATGTAEAGQYANTATVAAVDPLDEAVSDTDPSHYLGVQPGIQIEVATNGDDADTPTGPFALAGDPVTWTYTVTNPGDVVLSNIEVVDDQGVTVTYKSGDTDGDDLLDIDETWIYEATGTATVGQYTNIGSVTAEDAEGHTVGDDDTSHYHGVGVVIEAATNGQDADDAPGPVVAPGATVTWTYEVSLAHDAAASLDDVVVTDDAGTPDDTSDDFQPSFDGGDTNGNNLLDPGETWTYSASEVAVTGQYANTASVAGTLVNASGTAIAGVGTLSAQDVSHYTSGLGSLAGRVYADTNDNGTIDAQEIGLSGVTIALQIKDGDDWVEVDGQDPVVTAGDGSYLFENLVPGTYRLTQEQPEHFLDGRETAGSLGGDAGEDLISEIVIAADDEGTGYNFGERGLVPSMLSKRMYLASTPAVEDLMPHYLPEPAAEQTAEGVDAYIPAVAEDAWAADADIADAIAELAQLQAASDSGNDDPIGRQAATDLLLTLDA